MKVKVNFYEWSDVNRQPISFCNNEDFIEFCNASNINVSKRNLKFLKENEIVYSTCKNGKNELIMSNNYKVLKKNANRYRNNEGMEI